MTCNLVSGFFQRLDKLRKNAFGSMCVFGENNNNTITGIWVWRGQQLAFELSTDWQVDYESYKWTKLSPDDEKTKQLVNQYFLWEGEHNGKKIQSRQNLQINIYHHYEYKRNKKNRLQTKNFVFFSVFDLLFFFAWLIIFILFEDFALVELFTIMFTFPKEILIN